MRFVGVGAALVSLGLPGVVGAQLATVGAGVLVTKRPSVLVGELHAETPHIHAVRAYVTLSWTNESANPTVISAAERPLFGTKTAVTRLGAGLLWLEGNGYRPYPIVVSSTVVPLPIARTAVVGIASVQPFQDFEWSLVFKVGVTVWLVR